MGFVGSKYKETKDLSTVQIAALIRADIKAAVKAGELPAGKYGVKKERSTHSGKIEVTFRLAGDVDAFDRSYLIWREDNPHAPISSAPVAIRERRSRTVIETTNILEQIVRAYNRDDSDSSSDYFNCRFYEHVGANPTWRSERLEIEQLRARGFLVSRELFGDECQAVSS